MNATGPSAPLRGARVDELETVHRQAHQASARSSTSKQTWWKPSPLLARKRATPVVSSVGSTSSTLDSPTGQERDPDAVVLDGQHQLERQAEGVALEPERRLEVAARRPRRGGRGPRRRMRSGNAPAGLVGHRRLVLRP